MIYDDVGIGRHMYDLIMLLKQTIWIIFSSLYNKFYTAYAELSMQIF